MGIGPIGSTTRQDEWEVSEEHGKLLCIIRANYDEHALPDFLSMRTSDVPHRRSALVHLFGVDLPEDVPVKRVHDTFYADTSDQGRGIAAPDSHVAHATDILPPWAPLSRCPLLGIADHVDDAGLPADAAGDALPCVPLKAQA